MAPLLQKLPAHPYYCRDYPDYLEPTNSEPFYNVPRLSTIVSNIMGKSFAEAVGQEALAADGINDHILDMISFAGDYIGSLQLNWTRNKTINDTSITTKQKRVRPDVTIYCNGLLVMMGEEKDVREKLDMDKIFATLQEISGWLETF